MLSDSAILKEEKHMKKFDEPKIDFVIPWVDGSDPEWLAEFNKYAPESSRKNILDSRAERFRDYGLLRYWFRGVEKFAPWVNKVHFVTSGQKPGWLNLDAPKLHWVRHSDYIPSEYLPVFSANPIELMMHKIPGLAEKIVYFNDDFFLTAPVKKNYYFRRGLPCDFASLNVINVGKKNGTRIPHILLNDMTEINNHFDKKSMMKENFGKWVNLRYARESMKTICLTPWNAIPAITIRHHAQPFLKSTLDAVWENCAEKLESTMRHRFRDTLQDVNQWLFRFWQLCEGNFAPANHIKHERMVSISKWTEVDTKAIITGKYTEICIDDDTDENPCPDYEQKMRSIADAFETVLPEKSSFEV